MIVTVFSLLTSDYRLSLSRQVPARPRHTGARAGGAHAELSTPGLSLSSRCCRCDRLAFGRAELRGRRAGPGRYFYAMQAENIPGISASSNRTGVFSMNLVSGATP